VDHPLLVEYLREHPRAVRRDILGYAKRLGIVHIDFAMLKRTVKALAGGFMRGGGVEPQIRRARSSKAT